MNNLPVDFQFSQSSLQDYLDCARRFELRYILRQKWPAPQSEPVLEREAYMKLGQQFHMLAQQYFLGLPDERLSASVRDTLLQSWYGNLADAFPLNEIPPTRYSEISLTSNLGEDRLVAKMDLVIIDEQRQVYILDWKTSQKLPRRKYLEARIQSHMYPLAIVQAGEVLTAGSRISPQDVDMVYWFPNFPQHEETFHYSAAKYKEDIEWIGAMIREIRSTREGEFELTPNDKLCLFCNYRSLCRRGDQAGDWRKAEDLQEDLDAAISSIDFDISIDQIGEGQI
jgi:predicted RecB family nuclease